MSAALDAEGRLRRFRAAFFERWGSDRLGTSLRPVTVAELESMYVEEGHRSRGLGTRLVDEFLRWAEAEGAERASVTAYAANGRAIRFYRGSGFRPKSLSLEAGVG